MRNAILPTLPVHGRALRVTVRVRSSRRGSRCDRQRCGTYTFPLWCCRKSGCRTRDRRGCPDWPTPPGRRSSCAAPRPYRACRCSRSRRRCAACAGTAAPAHPGPVPPNPSSKAPLGGRNAGSQKVASGLASHLAPGIAAKNRDSSGRRSVWPLHRVPLPGAGAHLLLRCVLRGRRHGCEAQEQSTDRAEPYRAEPKRRFHCELLWSTENQFAMGVQVPLAVVAPRTGTRE